MQRSSERITIRLTPDQVEDFDSIVLAQDFKSRSQALRVAIENFIEEQVIDARGEKLVLEIPRKIMMRLDDLIEDGYVNDRHEAARSAIREYILKLEAEYIHGYDELKSKRQKINQELELRATSKEMEKR